MFAIVVITSFLLVFSVTRVRYYVIRHLKLQSRRHNRLYKESKMNTVATLVNIERKLVLLEKRLVYCREVVSLSFWLIARILELSDF